MTEGEALQQLVQLTGMSDAEWRDFLTLPQEAQAAAVEGYRAQDWARDQDVLGQVLLVLGVLATVAVDVSGVAGAVAALRAL